MNYCYECGFFCCNQSRDCPFPDSSFCSPACFCLYNEHCCENYGTADCLLYRLSRVPFDLDSLLNLSD